MFSTQQTLHITTNHITSNPCRILMQPESVWNLTEGFSNSGQVCKKKTQNGKNIYIISCPIASIFHPFACVSMSICPSFHLSICFFIPPSMNGHSNKPTDE
ncbi:hypothetical protein ILYODFUR_002739 [Ilyodon furcidens]|uniref:Uncharacterized protein n=1 Tax=Ilyodon furcidens TaxID=33524 RepID=A0ABV0VBE9_9TELE